MRSGVGRTGIVVLGATLGIAGLGACSGSPEPAAPDVTAEDLRDLEEAVAMLEERVAALEPPAPDPTDDAVPPAPSGAPSDPAATVLGDLDERLGEEVTVQARVSAPITVTDIGSVFSLADAAVPVVSATPTDALSAGVLVEVVGTVVRVDRASFERDFGIAADALLEEPGAWLARYDGEAAISADRLRVLEEPPDR
jgi:hypothetical protein